MNDLTTLLTQYRNRVDPVIKQAIFSIHNIPPVLRDAMHYSSANGGKRLRPLLVYATGHSFHQTPEALDPIAAAIECIHAYSLIHDDLPAMDDDTLRRGKPTCHIVFSEAIAILAGDALQTLAFDLLTHTHNTVISAEKKLLMIKILANFSGASGMIGGQTLDMLAENQSLSPSEIEHIHHLKTGALIRASVMLGALASECDQNTLDKLDIFATKLGLAFQLQDDLQDQIGTTKITGKNSGQDHKNHKSTYAITEGVSATQERIDAVMKEAKEILHSIEADTALLETLCSEVIRCKETREI